MRINYSVGKEKEQKDIAVGGIILGKIENMCNQTIEELLCH